MRRPKFSVFYDFATRAEALLVDIEAMAVMYSPEIKLDLISDKDDNMILELADACSADYLTAEMQKTQRGNENPSLRFFYLAVGYQDRIRSEFLIAVGGCVKSPPVKKILKKAELSQAQPLS